MVRALALRGKSFLRQTNTAPHGVFGMQGIKINLEAIITWLKKKRVTKLKNSLTQRRKLYYKKRKSRKVSSSRHSLTKAKV